MPSFKDTFLKYNWNQIKHDIYTKQPADVERALVKTHRNLEDFKALISPAADAYLEDMARQSKALTLQRFGNNMQLFAPMYLSNECQNICTYCGFSLGNKLPRKTLNPNEIDREVAALQGMGVKHILLVTGEANKTVGLEYFKKVLRQIRPDFAHISMEVQPLDEDEYRQLIPLGLHAVLVYQETYHQKDYARHHPKGKKSNFFYRLETPDRLGRAGVHKMGLGVLIGLEDWRVDSFYVALHLKYLEQTYWRTKYSISFPRLRPFSGGLDPKVEMTDRQLVQQITAYRLLNPDVELSLSTREKTSFRDHVFQLGITSMSAGSKTNPGGYATAPESLEQFEISDERSPSEIVALIKSKGYEPVWKDWDVALEHGEIRTEAI